MLIQADQVSPPGRLHSAVHSMARPCRGCLASLGPTPTQPMHTAALSGSGPGPGAPSLVAYEATEIK